MLEDDYFLKIIADKEYAAYNYYFVLHFFIANELHIFMSNIYISSFVNGYLLCLLTY